MHARLQANIVRRSLAAGVCESMEVTTPKFRKPRKAGGLVEAVCVALGWFVIAAVFALALVAAR